MSLVEGVWLKHDGSNQGTPPQRVSSLHGSIIGRQESFVVLTRILAAIHPSLVVH